jgi:nicotinamidase-related amidase
MPRRPRSMVAHARDHRADRQTSAHTLRDTDTACARSAGRPRAHMPIITGARGSRHRPGSPPRGRVRRAKHRWSAFHGTISISLRTQREHHRACGGSTDVGIASTAFAARDLDYNLVIVSDACTSPEGDNHDQFMRRVFPRMARVRTTAQVIAMWA